MPYTVVSAPVSPLHPFPCSEGDGNAVIVHSVSTSAVEGVEILQVAGGDLQRKEVLSTFGKY